MAAEEGMVVFQRGHQDDDNNDIWDDTALIEAYDKAINIMKSGLVDKNSPNVTEDAANGRKKRKNKRKHKRKDKSKASPHWNVGSHCRSIYTEDGQLYEGTIISVDYDTETCVVRYLGYGNEETQNLNDLLPSAIRGQRSRQDTQTQSENEMDWMSPRAAGDRTTPQKKPQQSQAPSPGWSAWPHPPSASGFSMPFPPFPAIPPVFPAMGSMPGPWAGFSAPQMPNLPVIPPPPVSTVTDDVLEADRDALCSMLMSWYMSGYHTGYYQGQKAGRKSNSDQNQTHSTDKPPQKGETG